MTLAAGGYIGIQAGRVFHIEGFLRIPKEGVYARPAQM
jgi:hypothetical protein